METKSRSLFIHALIYGLILGAIFIGLSLIYYILDVNLFSPGMAILVLVINLVIVIVALMMANNAYRDRYLGGKINFGQCFLIGFIIGLVGFILSTAYSYIFMTYIEPGYLEDGMNKIIDTYGSRLTEEQLSDMIEKMEKTMTPERQIRTSMISGVIISVVLGLITALFVKKDKTVSE